MIHDDAKASLMPYVISMLKGNEIKEVKTEFPVVFMEYSDDEEFSDVPDMADNSQYITVLSIKTPLYKYDQFCGPMGTRSMTRILKEWEANDNIIGVVLDIDCPGGQVAGLAEFAEFIHNYSKPIVSYTDGLVASAAFYVAAATKYCITNPHADFIGSIGTMLHYIDLDGMLTKEGAIIKDIYATKSPRKNEESRKMKDENSDALLIKNILDPCRDKFESDMMKYRPGMDAEVFDGAVYLPTEAIDKKMFDQMGTIKDAFDKVIELSNAGKNKNKKSNSNSNSNTMQTKPMPRLQAVLGLDAPLAITDNGSFLMEDSLQSIEDRIEALETTNSTLTSDLEAEQGKTTAAATAATTTEASIDAMMTEAGLTPSGDLTAKLTALSAKVTEMGGKDGAGATIIKKGDDAKDTPAKVVSGVNVENALNC